MVKGKGKVGGGSIQKTVCPISKSDFLANAKDLTFTLADGTTIVVEPREFSTGSFGWFFNGKIDVVVNGKKVKVQSGMNLIVVGSKEA